MTERHISAHVERWTDDCDGCAAIHDADPADASPDPEWEPCNDCSTPALCSYSRCIYAVGRS